MTAQQFRRDPKACVEHAEERKQEREDSPDKRGFNNTVHTVVGTAKPTNCPDEAQLSLGRMLAPQNKYGMRFSCGLADPGTELRRDQDHAEFLERERVREALQKADPKKKAKDKKNHEALQKHLSGGSKEDNDQSFGLEF